MAALLPMVRGELASSEALADETTAFVAEVQRVHRRYATEIVKSYALCPFVRDVDVAFGRFIVMLDREPNLESARRAVLEAESNVMHVVFPLSRPAPNLFERFASALLTSLKESFPEPPVMAAFHPDLVGDKGAPHRLIGLLRRAPDPFVQLIPAGMHEGGTVFATSIEEYEASPADRAEHNFRTLQGDPVERLLKTLAEIRADRDASYARFPKFSPP